MISKIKKINLTLKIIVETRYKTALISEVVLGKVDVREVEIV
jgi:hypothetical protein